MALPTIECFRSLDRINQIAAIYEALYVATGSAEELTPPECFLGENSRDQITDIFSALKLIGSPPGPDPVPVDMFIDYEQGTIGELVTLPMLTNSTHGGLGGSWEFLDADPDHTYIVAENLPRRVPLICDGVVYDGSGTKCINWDLTARYIGTLGIDVIRYQIPAGHINASVTFQVKFGANRDPDDVADVRQDHVMLTAGAQFAVMQQFIGTGEPVDSSGTIRSHSDSGGGSNFGFNGAIQKGVHYSVTLRLNTSTNWCELIILDGVTGAFVHASKCAADGGEVTRLTMQDYLTAFTGYTTYDNVALDVTNAAFPLEPFILPEPTGVSSVQTGFDELTVIWTSGAFTVNIDRRANGGPWVQIAADILMDFIRTTSSYVDSTVADGTEYEYRVTALINEHESAPAQSAPTTTDNASFLGTERHFLISTFNGGTTDQGSFIAYYFTTGIYPATITKFAMFGNPGQYDASQTIEVRLSSDDSLVATRTINFQTTEAYIITDVADILLAANTQFYLNFPTMNFNTARNFTIGSVNPVGGITFDGTPGFPNAGIGPVDFYYTLSPP